MNRHPTESGIGRGWFITFEGGEGSGKTTQIEMLAERLRADGYDVVTTREPGGSPGGEAIRHVLLSGAAEQFGAEMEALLFSAARSDHVEHLIRPALKAGKVVLCDRFFDSTRVYQGQPGGVDREMLERLERVACEDCWPDITVILDLDPEIGMERAAARRDSGQPDRFEKEDVERQRAWRRSYLDIAENEPERCAVIDAASDAETVHESVWTEVQNRMRDHSPGWLNGKVGQEG